MGGKPRFKPFTANDNGIVTSTEDWRYATNGKVEVNGNTYENVTIKRTLSYVDTITAAKERFSRGVIFIRQTIANTSFSPNFKGEETHEDGKISIEIPVSGAKSPGTFLVFKNYKTLETRKEEIEEYVKAKNYPFP
jgi:hypothetical protein